MTQPSPFQFATEFTPNGDVLSGPSPRYISREDADQLANKIRAEADTRARQAVEAKGFAAVDRIVVNLAPVAAQLSAVAEQLRAEAAELAMIAARKIAGAALDKNGEETAMQAISDVIRQLKLSPTVTVSVAPEALPEMERRLEQLRSKGIGGAIAFVPDASAKPGDWRVTWAEGSSGFTRAGTEAAIDDIINARLQDPVAPQLDLFSAA